MRKVAFLFFVLFLLSFSLASADLIPAGQKFVKYTFEIENQEEYSEYLFFLHGEPLVSGIAIEKGQDLFFYKHTQPHIYAIKKVDFNQEELDELKKNENYKELQEYFTTNPNLIKSDLQLKNYGLVSEFDPLVSAKDILKIAYLSEECFIVVKDKIIYTYDDGTVEVKEANAMNPNPSRTTILPSWTIQAVIIAGFLLSLVALVLIIILVVRRLRR